MLRRLVLTAGVVVLVQACSWVELTQQGERVDLMNSQQAVDCERIGTTTAEVLDKVGFVDRSEEKQVEELQTLARNEAAAMGGDAIVPATEITDGRQRFVVYRCR